jgi:hypothetical protein
MKENNNHNIFLIPPQYQHMYKRVLFLLILFCIVVSPIAAVSTYKELARYPDQHVGDVVTFTGRVNEAVYEVNGCVIRMYTGKNSAGYYEDDMFVVFTGEPSNGRILEDDIIKITGTSVGLYKYETVMGAPREIPWVLGESYTILS